jgi:CubicO group peptidase (beta-lactamase class C family)
MLQLSGNHSQPKSILRLTNAVIKFISFCIFFGSTLIANAQEKFIDSLLKEANVSGIQLIWEKDNKVKEYDLGFINDSSKKKINAHTIFQAASLSKSVFAYAVLRLCDRSVINLDSPLLQYLGTYERFKSNDPGYSKITARMVLRHSTGLPNWGNDSSVKLIFTPDSMFSYSGEGFWFLQRVLEKKLGKPLNDIMEQEVFRPLHMQASAYVWKSAFDSVASMSHTTAEEIKNYERANAAFSLLTNAHDYNIFLSALLSGKGLSAGMHTLMFQKSISGKRFNETNELADPYIFWGLGVGLVETKKGMAIWHWGDNGNYKCFYFAYPKTGERLIYFTHSQRGLDMTSSLLMFFIGHQNYWTSPWLGYEYSSPATMVAFRSGLNKKGYGHAMEQYEELKKRDSGFSITENDLNKLGYKLLGDKKIGDAIEVFKLNVSLFPSSSNVYDSLGEAFADNGEKEQAIKNYKRSLELNPANQNAAEQIKKLETK